MIHLDEINHSVTSCFEFKINNSSLCHWRLYTCVLPTRKTHKLRGGFPYEKPNLRGRPDPNGFSKETLRSEWQGQLRERYNPAVAVSGGLGPLKTCLPTRTGLLTGTTQREKYYFLFPLRSSLFFVGWLVGKEAVQFTVLKLT